MVDPSLMLGSLPKGSGASPGKGGRLVVWPLRVLLIHLTVLVDYFCSSPLWEVSSGTVEGGWKAPGYVTSINVSTYFVSNSCSSVKIPLMLKGKNLHVLSWLWLTKTHDWK